MTTIDNATNRHTPLSQTSRSAPANVSRGAWLRTAILALTTAALTLPAYADNGSAIIKKRLDKDVTVIVIDNNDRHKKRIVEERPRDSDTRGLIKRRDDRIRIIYDDDRHDRRIKTEHSDGRDANAIISRSDDGTYVRIPDRKGDGFRRKGNSGPKIIVIDRNSGACKGSGVCVIRP